MEVEDEEYLIDIRMSLIYLDHVIVEIIIDELRTYMIAVEVATNEQTKGGIGQKPPTDIDDVTLEE